MAFPYCCKVTKLFNFIIGRGAYLLIGNLKAQTDVIKYIFPFGETQWCYYFYDNFLFYPCEDTIPQKEKPNVVFIPNIFSPNCDDANDVYRVRGEQIENWHIQI